MSTAKRLVTFATAILLLVTTVRAQQQTGVSSSRSAIMITAVSTAERIRFTAPSTVVQMRIEVYSANGEKLFDNEIRGGNVFDWHLQDGQAGRLLDGSYLCVITTKSLSGRLSQKLGKITIENAVASVEATDATQLTGRQTQAVGPIEENASLTVLKEGENQTPTVIAHNGEEGQIIRGRGALSFRIGDFFSAKDTEQMRLTEEGNLGIGTSDPKLKLDVAGMIGARDGVMFSDGSTLSVNRKGVLTHTTSKGNIVPSVAGTGTQNQLPKWTDNSGTLGDSAIVDVSGNIGIGTTSPQTGLDYHNAQAPFFTRDFPTNPGNAVAGLQLGLSNAGSRNVNVGPSFLFFGENTAGAKSFLGRVSAVWENPTAGSEAGAMFFQVRANSADANALTERMRITSAGNVGIGVPAPTAKLDVAGDVNTATQYNIAGSRVLSIQGNSNTTVGLATGITGGNNSFFGAAAGANNSTGFQNSYFGVSAGRENLSGAANSYFGYDAGRFNTGSSNTFVGKAAGGFSTIGTNNTFIGSDASPSVNNLTFATAIGSGAIVTASNTVTLGRFSDTVQIPGAVTVNGTVQNNSGGFKFPDGSVQTVAAANTTYTTTNPNQTTEITHTWPTGPATTIVHLNLPPGTYLVTGTVNFDNQANYFNQDNSRSMVCYFTGDDTYQGITIPAPNSFTHGGLTLTMHSVMTITSGGVSVECHNEQFAPNQDKVFVYGGNHLTAVKLSGNVIVQ